MKNAIENVKTIEVTRAVRSTQIGGLKIKKKQIISLLDNELITVGNNAIEVVMDTLNKINLEENEILTMYYGSDTALAEAEKAALTIREKYKNYRWRSFAAVSPLQLHHFDRITEEDRTSDSKNCDR